MESGGYEQERLGRNEDKLNKLLKLLNVLLYIYKK